MTWTFTIYVPAIVDDDVGPHKPPPPSLYLYRLAHGVRYILCTRVTNEPDKNLIRLTTRIPGYMCMRTTVVSEACHRGTYLMCAFRRDDVHFIINFRIYRYDVWKNYTIYFVVIIDARYRTIFAFLFYFLFFRECHYLLYFSGRPILSRRW